MKRCNGDVSAGGETRGCIPVSRSDLTISERSSERNMNEDFALWLQVHLQTHTHTHNYIPAYTKSKQKLHGQDRYWHPQQLRPIHFLQINSASFCILQCARNVWGIWTPWLKDSRAGLAGRACSRGCDDPTLSWECWLANGKSLRSKARLAERKVFLGMDSDGQQVSTCCSDHWGET